MKKSAFLWKCWMLYGALSIENLFIFGIGMLFGFPISVGSIVVTRNLLGAIFEEYSSIWFLLIHVSLVVVIFGIFWGLGALVIKKKIYPLLMLPVLFFLLYNIVVCFFVGIENCIVEKDIRHVLLFLPEIFFEGWLGYLFIMFLKRQFVKNKGE